MHRHAGGHARRHARRHTAMQACIRARARARADKRACACTHACMRAHAHARAHAPCRLSPFYPSSSALRPPARAHAHLIFRTHKVLDSRIGCMTSLDTGLHILVRYARTHARTLAHSLARSHTRSHTRSHARTHACAAGGTLGLADGGHSPSTLRTKCRGMAAM